MKKGLKVLKPRPPIIPQRLQTPQCCVQPDEQFTSYRISQWRKERYARIRPEWNPEQCQLASVVLIDEKPYCRKHAGIIALDKWMKGELTEVKK